jgi:hypothetical protein
MASRHLQPETQLVSRCEGTCFAREAYRSRLQRLGQPRRLSFALAREVVTAAGVLPPRDGSAGHVFCRQADCALPSHYSKQDM